jgi:diguanylate cyclase (GGDEF)-like protein
MTDLHATDHQDSARSRVWRVPVTAGIAAIAARFAFGEQVVGVAASGCAAFVVAALFQARRHAAGLRPRLVDLRSPWLCIFAGAVLAAFAAALRADPDALPPLLLTGAGLLAVGMAILAGERLRTNAVELLAEGVIATAGSAILVWGLLVQPQLTSSTDAVATACGFLMTALSTTVVVCILWLRFVDEETDTPSMRLLAGTSVLLGAAGVVVLVDSFRGGDPTFALVDPMLIGALALAGAAIVHPSHLALRVPALKTAGTDIARRAAITLSAVLVGPLLLGLQLGTSLDISVSFAAMSSVLLSLVVSAHVFRLLRRWGALEHDVFHDSLTGLPNRQFFNRRLQLAIQLAAEEHRTMAVMFLDLDRFKTVNDSLGHAAGNMLLCQVAKRLRESTGESAVVSRLAGDEFAILLPEVDAYRHTVAVAQRVIDSFGSPFEIGRRQLYVTPSIGVAHYPTDGLEPAELLEHADAAMYRAKEKGRNTVELYTVEKRAQARNRLDLDSALHRAIADEQLRIEYQPKVSLAEGRIVGVEALLRWDHPVLGSIPPEEFIPVAEENGMIGAIGEWVMLEACTQARAWMDGGIEDLSVAVNLSPRQFQLHRVQDLIARVLRLTNLPPELLEVEVTESLAMHDAAALSAAVAELRDMGVRCAIDDFGVGYNGLGYIDQFAVDAIKIDRQFVRRIGATGSPIVTALLAMARGLRIDVVAEGVETIEQLEFLRSHGCHTMQGFLFSPPLPAADVEPLLRNARRIIAGSTHASAR